MRVLIRSWLERPFTKIVVLVALAAVAAAARSKPEMTPDDVSLAGQLLIASPSIGDPLFERAVILMVRHNKAGAFGIAINRPLGERPLATLLESVGEDAKGVEGQVPLFAGGPVEPKAGFVVHSAEYHRAETLTIDARLAMTSTPAILSDIAHRAGPAKALIAFGYCGWGPGQLEGELAQNGWFTAPADPKLVFDEDRAKVWDEAMERRTRPL